MFDHVHIRARRLLPGLVAMALLAMAGTASAATPPGHYTISATGGAVYPLQTSGNLVSGAVDDRIYYLSTTGSGLTKLPFTISFYNHGYKKIGISSNGNVQFGVDPVNVPGGIAWTNDCLPTGVFSKTVAMPFWDDLGFNTADSSLGYDQGRQRRRGRDRRVPRAAGSRRLRRGRPAAGPGVGGAGRTSHSGARGVRPGVDARGAAADVHSAGGAARRAVDRRRLVPGRLSLEPLGEPVVAVRLLVERLDLLVPRAAVHGDRLA